VEQLAIECRYDQALRKIVGNRMQPHFAFEKCLGRPLAFGDVGANGDILVGFTVAFEKWNDRGGHPVKGTVLRSVFDLPVPDPAASDRRPQVADEFLRVEA